MCKMMRMCLTAVYGSSRRVPQRRRITARLRAQVIEHYNRGMSSRRVAATLGLGRTTVMEILKVAAGCVQQSGVRVGADHRYRRVVAE